MTANLRGPDRLPVKQQHAMMEVDEEQEFTTQFVSAVHALLVSCSRQEVLNYFSQFQPRRQDFVYKVFTFTATDIRENVLAEFRTICKKTQVAEAFNYVNIGEFRQSIFPGEAFREVAVKRKQEEVERIKETPQQITEENNSLAIQLEGLREEVNESKNLRSVNVVVEKVSNSNLKLEEVLR